MNISSTLHTNHRAKTPWTPEENLRLFRAMAEYLYVDHQGLRPLAIYLNPHELDHVEALESEEIQMSDDEIAASLIEQAVEQNPTRRADLLFYVLRHLQKSSGNQHSTRVVNEKIKNIRSRIINWFITMSQDGGLPTKRPVRYVAAIINCLMNSPFFPLGEWQRRERDDVYLPVDAKHDVSIWLDAMCWLYPQEMYEFVSQCAWQVVKRQAQEVPMAWRSPEEHKVLEETDGPIDILAVMSLLRQLVEQLNGKKSAAGKGGGRPGRRKRKNSVSRSSSKRQEMKKITLNDGKVVSLSRFELFKTEEKLEIAGKPVKLIAGVGGVIRMGEMARADIKYHLYRLWTCVATFSDIASLLQNGPQMGGEFVVVRHFLDVFENDSIEPRLRVSKERKKLDDNQILVDLIEEAFAGSAGEYRQEIPVWLTISRRSDNRYVIGLVVTSPLIVVPSPGMGLFRVVNDQMLTKAVLDQAIESKGAVQVPMGDQWIALGSMGGLEVWPQGEATQSALMATSSGHDMLRVASLAADSANILDPWTEPRVLNNQAYELQKVGAGSPVFEQLNKQENRIQQVQKISTELNYSTPPAHPLMSLGNTHYAPFGTYTAAVDPALSFSNVGLPMLPPLVDTTGSGGWSLEAAAAAAAAAAAVTADPADLTRAPVPSMFDPSYLAATTEAGTTEYPQFSQPPAI